MVFWGLVCALVHRAALKALRVTARRPNNAALSDHALIHDAAHNRALNDNALSHNAAQ